MVHDSSPLIGCENTKIGGLVSRLHGTGLDRGPQSLEIDFKYSIDGTLTYLVHYLRINFVLRSVKLMQYMPYSDLLTNIVMLNLLMTARLVADHS